MTTIDFENWVAEYKPIEFNLDHYVNVYWARLDFVKKYFVNFDKAREFPVNHVSYLCGELGPSPSRRYPAPAAIYFVTRKPRSQDNELIEVKFGNVKFEIFYPDALHNI